MQPALDNDSLAEWPHYTEIVVVRCLAAIHRRGLLPSQEEISATASRSRWLAFIGGNTLVETYKDLCRLARSIVRCEDQFAVEQLPHFSHEFSSGEWVCSASSGVTEVVSVSGSTVEIAMVGLSDTEDEWFLEVSSEHLRPANIPTKVRIGSVGVAEELDHLLPYTDEDFEDWHDIIMPQLQRGYFISWRTLSRRARSLQLRNEVNKLLAPNAGVASPGPACDPAVVATEGEKEDSGHPGIHILLTCSDENFSRLHTAIVKNLKTASEATLARLSRNARSSGIRKEASRLLGERSPPSLRRDECTHRR
jgi:hypothetical protein